MDYYIAFFRNCLFLAVSLSRFFFSLIAVMPQFDSEMEAETGFTHGQVSRKLTQVCYTIILWSVAYSGLTSLAELQLLRIETEGAVVGGGVLDDHRGVPLVEGQFSVVYKADAKRFADN